MFVAPTDFCAQRAQIELLQGEQPKLLGRIARDIGFFAKGVEITVEILDAAGALPAIAGLLHQLGAGFEAVVEEGGADGTGAFDFVVLIFGPAEAEVQLFKGVAKQRHDSARIDTGLAHVERDVLMAMALLVMVVAMVVIVTIFIGMIFAEFERVGDAVAIFEMAEYHTEAAAIIGDIGQAATDIPGARRSILHPAARLCVLRHIAAFGFGFIAKFLREDITTGAVIAGFEETAIKVQHDTRFARRDIQAGAAATLFRRRAEIGHAIEVEAAIRDFARDPPVLDVDDAADGARAIEQRRRAAQDFDAVGEQRIDSNGVIDRGVRNVEAADAIGQDTNALGIETAQNRPRGVGAKEGRTHARLPRQGFTDRRAHLAQQCVALQHGDCRCHQLPITAVRRGDDDFGIGRAVKLRRCSLGSGRSRLLCPPRASDAGKQGGDDETASRHSKKHPLLQQSRS